MKKYYATQCDIEWFDFANYYDEETAAEDKFAIIENRDYERFGWEGYEDMKRILRACFYDLDTYSSEEDRDEDEETKEVLKGYFSKINNNLTDEQLNRLKDICSGLSTCNLKAEVSYIIEALEIVYGIKFITGIMRGCSQGDWFEYICPETLKPKLDWIEAVLMGTGTEFCITCEPVEEGTDLDEVDCYHDYTELYTPEDIKKWIADNNHTTPENVVLRTIKDTYTTKHYKYEEQ